MARVNGDNTTTAVRCDECPLRSCSHLRPFTPEELAFIASFKNGELILSTGATVFTEGTRTAYLYTVLGGWAFRYKMLEDGRRQILNYCLPGDLVGLQGTLMGEMQHSLEALSPLRLCTFPRDRLGTLYSGHPGLAYDITWLAAREEAMLDEHLLSVGRRSALERAAYLLAFLHHRARQTGLIGGNRNGIPLTQTHVADTLGLSLVHTNKTLRKLVLRGFIRWQERECRVLDAAALQDIAGWTPDDHIRRPFL